MTDIRSLTKKNIPGPVNDVSFVIEREAQNGGFRVRLLWNYAADPNVVGFKVYKAVLPKPTLFKNYQLSQRALEKFSGTRQLKATTTILYNKSRFSQNSKVKFDNSNSTNHDKTENSLKSYSYFYLTFIIANRSKDSYSLLDKNIKFGETYFYYVSAITKNLQETTPVPIRVNVESLSPPAPPYLVRIYPMDIGLNLICGNNQDQNVEKFLIYKRELNAKDFVFVGELENRNEMMSFTDLDVLPKKNYIYRVYSVDMFGNKSLYGTEQSASFKYIPLLTDPETIPDIRVSSINGEFIKLSFKNFSSKTKSVRVERRDDWMFETAYEIKSYDGKPLPNNHFFNERGELEIIDYTTAANRVYSYRISNYDVLGNCLGYQFMNYIRPGEEKTFDNFKLDEFQPPKLIDFDVSVINSRQNPVFVSCSWKITGEWSYLVIIHNDASYKVDDIHSSVVLPGMKRGKSYTFSVEVFDYQNIKKDELRGIVVNL